MSKSGEPGEDDADATKLIGQPPMTPMASWTTAEPTGPVSVEPLGTVGRYELLKKIGTGGMGEVFLAQAAGPAGFQKKVVVKRVRAALAESERAVQMFLREARLAARLAHSNCV